MDALVLGLLIACGAAFAIHKIVAHDVWWQLGAGEWIVAHGIPSTDPFSFFAIDRPWIEMRWLYCLLAHLLHRGLGLNALILAKTAILLAALFGFLWRMSPGSAIWTRNLAVLACLSIAHLRFQLRPEVITYLCLTILLFGLHRFVSGGDRRWMVAIPLMQVAWTNLHTLFVLGPVVSWLFVIAELVAARSPLGKWIGPERPLAPARLRSLVVMALASTVACLVNPYFVKGALFPLVLYGEIRSGHVFNEWIDEFRPPFAFFGRNDFTVAYPAVIVVSALAMLLNRRHGRPGSALLWAAFLYLSLLAQRNTALFAIVASAGLLLDLAGLAARRALRGRLAAILPWGARLLCAGFALIMIPALASDFYYVSTDPAKRFGFGVSPRRFPIQALAFVRQQRLPLPVIAGLGDGGYVLFDGGPRSVFVDGRLEVYGGELLGTALELLQTGRRLDEITRRLGVHTIVARHPNESELIRKLEASPRWIPVYFDSRHVVYVSPRSEHLATVERLRVDWKHPVAREVAVPAAVAPPDWLAGLWPKVADDGEATALGGLFLLVGNLSQARESYETALRLNPRNEATRLHLGLIYRAIGKSAEASALLASVGERLQRQRDVLVLGASIAEMAGRPAEAMETYRQRIANGDDDVAVWEGLARSALAAGSLDTAIPALRRIAALRPGDAHAWNNLGVAVTRAGLYEEALAALSRSLRLDPRQPSVLNQIGIVSARLGKTQEAAAAFTGALAIDPAYTPAKRNLENLRAAAAPPSPRAAAATPPLSSAPR